MNLAHVPNRFSIPKEKEGGTCIMNCKMCIRDRGHPVSAPGFPADAPAPEITHVRVPASAVHPLSPVLAV